jgi:hypothetical protein
MDLEYKKLLLYWTIMMIVWSIQMSNGSYGLSFSKKIIIEIEITCLEYSKTSKLITVSQVQNFVLKKKVEALKEVIVRLVKK